MIKLRVVGLVALRFRGLRISWLPVQDFVSAEAIRKGSQNSRTGPTRLASAWPRALREDKAPTPHESTRKTALSQHSQALSFTTTKEPQWQHDGSNGSNGSMATRPRSPRRHGHGACDFTTLSTWALDVSPI